jgi:TRAP-type C4-dicarboxylate transport system permease small subunit
VTPKVGEFEPNAPRERHFMRLVLGASKWASAIALATMMMLTVADVVGRNFFGQSVLIANEVSGYALVALIFLSLAYGDAKDKTIVITMVTDRLPPSLRTGLAAFVLATSTALLAWLAWFTSEPARVDWELGSTSLTGARMPIWIPEAFISAGLALLTIQFARRLVGMARGKRSFHIETEDASRQLGPQI